MKKIILIIMITTLSIFATNNSFYFIAKATNEGVYLRWDAIDGNFPETSDIDYIVLKRNGKIILRFNPREFMSIDDIKRHYQNPLNQNSLIRTIDNISKNKSADCYGANISNYSTKIYGCMANSMWRDLSSKVDFSIATIGYRAYLDTGAKKGKVQYELIAIKSVNKKNIEKYLGRIEIDSSLPSSVLGAKNFKQVMQHNDCTTPDYAKDHYSVSLSWENGGSKTDAFANSIMLGGYDLYRVVGNSQPLPNNYNFAKMAKETAVDSSGNYQFKGVEKVNDVPILLANNRGDETPLFLETKDELKKRGLKAGDVRWYYLVAKDFTGHYGPSVPLKVTIPSLLPPVTPWEVRVVEDSGKVTLIWENETVSNYVRHYGSSRKFCNINRLIKDEPLRFVDKGDTCGSREIEVNLNIRKYYIYRFDDPHSAAKFSDSDLDGIGDLDEKKNQTCKENTPHGGTLVKTLNASDFRGKEFIKFSDSIGKSKYYWYRIASVSYSKIPSILTPPIRALLPNRTLPKKAKVELKECVNKFDVRVKTFDEAKKFIAHDDTGLAKEIKISWNDGDNLSKVLLLPIIEDNPFKGWVSSNNKDLNSMKTGGTIDFLGPNKEVLGSISFDRLSSGANRKYYELTFICSKTRSRKVTDGGDTKSTPFLEFVSRFGKNECVKLTLLNSAGDRQTVATECNVTMGDTINLDRFDIPNLGKGEKYCFAVNVVNRDNQYSPTTYLPCFGMVDATAPHKPDVRSFKINDNNMTFSWLPPQEKIASTIISIYNEDNHSLAYLRTYPHPAHLDRVSEDGLTLERSINISLTEETKKSNWCIKAKSVGFNQQGSKWSKKRCARAKVNKPEYLPWPKIESVGNLDGFSFEYDNGSVFGVRRLSYLLAQKKISIPKPEVDSRYMKRLIDVYFKSVKLNFLLYRQEKEANSWSTFTQVSPLVNRLKFIKKRESYTINAVTYTIYELENNLIVKVIYIDESNVESTISLYYEDIYPYKINHKYKYVRVNFDKEHEIENYSISEEVYTGVKR